MGTHRKIAVAGATGRVGRHLVDILTAGGHDVVPISRSGGVDLITREGLAEALTGVDVVIDAATGPSPEEHAATEFFTTASRNLQEEGKRAGVKEIIAVSIINVDQFTHGYGAAKIAHEQATLAGPVPGRVLRAAQFHELVDQLVTWGTQGDVTHVPVMRTQLVAARTVAEGLAALATDAESAPAPAASGFPEIAGPREESLVDAATLLVSRRGEHVHVEGVTDPTDPASELYVSGALLPGPGATLAGPTFEEWLASNA
jgi:uncharacterized protein YbjT (DUF2867 family)